MLGYMKKINLNPVDELTAKTVPAIVEKQIHRGLQFCYPENYPSWAIFRSQILALAKRTADRSKYPFAFTGLVAALAYDIPTMSFPLRLDARYTDGKPRGSSRVGKFGDLRGIQVIRQRRPIPLEAISEACGLPVLEPVRFLLDILTFGSLRDALAGGDALVRQLVGADRKLTQTQRARFQELLAQASKLAPDYLPEYQVDLALSRLPLLSLLAESPLESVVRAILIEADLTRFIEQFEIFSEGGVFYADFYLPDLNVVLECDGEGKYAVDPDHASEKTRQQLIEDKGFTVVRISWKESQNENSVRKLVKRLKSIK